MIVKQLKNSYEITATVKHELYTALNAIIHLTLVPTNTNDDYTSFKINMTEEQWVMWSNIILCKSTNKKARELWNSILLELKDYNENLYNSCTPYCIECMYCKNGANCGYIDKFKEACDNNKYKITNKEIRYEAFRIWRRAENTN